MTDISPTLRAKFIERLPIRWSEISLAASAADCGAALHRLAGAAGSHGFDELGQAARRAELSAKGMEGGWPNAAALEDLRLALEAATGTQIDTV
jgi:HPt (histidine-containing phosphotransfer) domain-containing protein